MISDKKGGGPMRNTCAFTGHRPEKLPWRRGETDEGCKRLKRALYNQIVRYANAGVTDYLSGMAEGVDTWAAQSVLLLRRQSSSIRLHCILLCTARADLRYSGHCALCSKAGAGDLGAGPGNSSHRL